MRYACMQKDLTSDMPKLSLRIDNEFNVYLAAWTEIHFVSMLGRCSAFDKCQTDCK